MTSPSLSKSTPSTSASSPSKHVRNRSASPGKYAPNKSTHLRNRSPDPRPFKRRRRWCDTVEQYALANGIEDDAHRIAQRQKQIDFGKNTIAYDRFIAVCPREKRGRGDPMTPIAKQKCSKRSFAGQITSWKKKVYGYVATLDEAAVAAATATAKTAGAMKELTSSASAENKVLGKLNTTPTKTSSSTENAGMLITPDAANASEPNTPPVAVSTPLEADDEEDEEFSDLDDIELDDQGNVITTEPAKSNLEDSKKPQNEDICVEDSPMSIFSAF